MTNEHPPLPRLLVILDGFATGRMGRDVGAVWMRAQDVERYAHVRFFMLRDHRATEHEATVAADMLAGYLFPGRPRRRPFRKDLRKEFRQWDLTRPARYRMGEPSVYLVVNSHPVVAHEARIGLHVGSRGPAVASVREDVPLLGYSAHTPEEARQAARDEADYVVFSPIFATASKPGHPGVGLEALAAAVQAARPIPVYALGGITPGRVRKCLDAGAHGVAVLSGILDAPDAVAAALAYQSALHA